MSTAFPLVHILLPTGVRVTYEIAKATTVTDIIDLIKADSNVTKPPNRTICIIYHGHVLSGHEQITQLDTLDEFTLHLCFRGGAYAASDPAVELRGFDRLARMNYSPDQIAEVRRDFHVTHGSTHAAPDDQIEMEEEWFPVIFNNENPLQMLRPPPPPRAENPIAANAEAPPPEDDDAFTQSPLVRFTFGLIVGAIFGVGSVIFVVWSSQDGVFLLGLGFGIATRLWMQYEFNLL
jgi:hypothetical protein